MRVNKYQFKPTLVVRMLFLTFFHDSLPSRVHNMIHAANIGPANALAKKKISNAFVLGKIPHWDKINGINTIHENKYAITKNEVNG